MPITPILYIVVIALSVGGGWYWKSSYDESRREEGRAQMRPMLAAATVQLEADVLAFRQIESSMGTMKARAEAVRMASGAAAKANEARQQRESERLLAIETAPVAGDTECARIQSAIGSVLR